MPAQTLLAYLALMVLGGPGIILYGLLITVRQRVRLSRKKVCVGGAAVVAGVGTIAAGAAFTWFLWRMLAFFPP